MRSSTARVRRLGAAGAAVLVAAMALLAVGAPAAQAAGVPAHSLTPYVSCYWDNGNQTITVSVGVTSTNTTTVSVPVGTDNRVTVGAVDRGQPTSFAPGNHANVWAATVTWADISNGINWSLSGNLVTIASDAKCSSKPVPAEGNAGAVLAFGALVTIAGAAVLGRRHRRSRPAAPEATA
jgi:hypothetical protein